MKKRIRDIFFTGFCLWALGMTVFYFSKNQWPVASMFKTMLAFTVLASVFVGTGRKIMILLRLDTVTFLEELCMSFGAGIGAVSVIMMIAGFFGLYRPVYIYMLLAGLVILTFKGSSVWARNLYSKWKQHSHNRFSFTGAVFLIIIVFCFAAAFINALAPPFEKAVITGSLAAAKQLVLHGGIFRTPDTYVMNLPPAMSMLQVLGLLVYGTAVSKLITFLMLIVLSAGIFSMTRRFFHRKIALFAVTITISTPVVVRLYLMDHPFIASLFFSFLSLYSFIIWYRAPADPVEQNDNWIILSGAFAAFSLVSGYYALFSPLALLLMIFFRTITLHKETEVREITAKLALFLMPFTVILFPLFIKNLIYCGRPLFPLFSNLEEFAANGLEGTKSLWGYLYPLWHIPFEHEITADNFFYLGTLFIIFLPAVFLIKELGRTIRIVIVYFIIYLFIYLVAGRKPVFLFSVIPAVSIITAYIIINLYGQKKYFYQFVMAVFFISLAVNLYIICPWLKLTDKVNVVMGYVDREDYLDENVPGFGVFDYIDKQTGKNSKILLVGETPNIYINRETVSGDAFSVDKFILMARKIQDADILKKKISDTGATHVLVNTQGIQKFKKCRSYAWDDKIEAALNSLIEKHMILRFSRKDHYLYELQ
ncbi:MAG: hypothetical protein ABIH89_03410 [Elusimicrobiota bacterium]